MQDELVGNWEKDIRWSSEMRECMFIETQLGIEFYPQSVLVEFEF